MLLQALCWRMTSIFVVREVLQLGGGKVRRNEQQQHMWLVSLSQGWGRIRFVKYIYKNLDFSNTNTNTVETLYNTINYCWSTHKRHSIARPKGRGMGVSFVSSKGNILCRLINIELYKILAIINRAIKGLHCILFNFDSTTYTNTLIQIQIRSTKYICWNCSDPK